MSKERDVRIREVSLFYLPIQTRVPLKFGPETTTEVTCARVRMVVETRSGKQAVGWGETPLSVAWVWPSEASYSYREEILKQFTRYLLKGWRSFKEWGHPMELGHQFLEFFLPSFHKTFQPGNFHQGTLPQIPRGFSSLAKEAEAAGSLPWLAALVCCSPFDLALHDAYGEVHQISTYSTYTKEYMNQDLSTYYDAEDASLFKGKYPTDFFRNPPAQLLPAWHLVGGKDPLRVEELTGREPRDGYPLLLSDWIRTDGLTAVKIKLTGMDSDWDYQRLVEVGRIALAQNVLWLTADFNCTVQDPRYVEEILDRLLVEYPRIYAPLLYIEQPFPYDLEAHPWEVHGVSSRKPLFMDESAHDWRFLRLGRSLGWTGVALKTCKTQTGALLSLCWAKAHGMTLMVQDLTNPRLAQISHLLLAAYTPTLWGVETNS
ncbi:MAG: enolase C-terminal domain-like protein, partial [Spirochaetales bacterium]